MADQAVTIKTENLFDLDIFNKGTDAEFIYTVFRFSKNSREAGEGISGRMHLIAIEEENLESPTTAVMNFRNRVMNAIKEAKKLHQDMDFKLVGFNLKEGKLTGNSPIANSVKQISNAWEYGGSLIEDFTFNGTIHKKLATVSQCRKFAQDAKAFKEQQEQKNKVFSEQESLLKKEFEAGDWDSAPGTKEFNAEVMRRTSKIMALGNGEEPESEDGEDVIHDQWYEKGMEFATELRKIVSLNNGDSVQALAMANARIKELSDSIAKKIAAKAGLTKQADAA